MPLNGVVLQPAFVEQVAGKSRNLCLERKRLALAMRSDAAVQRQFEHLTDRVTCVERDLRARRFGPARLAMNRRPILREWLNMLECGLAVDSASGAGELTELTKNRTRLKTLRSA